MEHGTQGLGAKDLERVLCGATPAVIKKTRTACVTPSVMTISLLHTTPVHSRKSVHRLSAIIQSYMVTVAACVCTPFYTTTLRTPGDQWRPGLAFKFHMLEYGGYFSVGWRLERRTWGNDTSVG